MWQYLIAFLAIGMIPAFALDAGEYYIEDQTGDILILVEVTAQGSVIQDVFLAGNEVHTSKALITDNGENARIFGETDNGKKVYIIYDKGDNTLNVKTWHDGETTRLISNPEVNFIF